MKIPFTTEQFLEVFKNYNQVVFPMQIIFYVISALAIYLAIKPNPLSDKTISIILAFLWLWMGIVYHLIFFTEINKAAYLFGTLFIIQGILFYIFGVFQNKLSFNFRPDKFGITGIILMLFALIIYPILGYFLGHVYPSSPTFGLPCPTTIFTFGFLLLNIKKTPLIILIIPFVWSIIGFMAALQFGIIEDTGLLIASLVTVSLLIYRNTQLHISKYLINCFLLTIPILLWNIILANKLPKSSLPEIFLNNISSFITYGENISRTIMFILIFLMPLKILTTTQKKGVALFGAGTLVYFASWLILIYFPNSMWSKSVFGLLAPAYTPLFWLIGIGLIGDSLYFNIPYRRRIYFLVVIVFLIFHNWHTYLIYFRTH